MICIQTGRNQEVPRLPFLKVWGRCGVKKGGGWCYIFFSPRDTSLPAAVVFTTWRFVLEPLRRCVCAVCPPARRCLCSRHLFLFTSFSSNTSSSSTFILDVTSSSTYCTAWRFQAIICCRKINFLQKQKYHQRWMQYNCLYCGINAYMYCYMIRVRDVRGGLLFRGAGRGKGKNPRGGAGRKSAQINQFKNFTKVRKI